MAIRVLFDVNQLSDVMRYFDSLAVYKSDTQNGTYAEITDPTTRIAFIPEQEQYYYYDDDGSASSWYKARYYDSVGDTFGEYGTAVSGDSSDEKVGYTFGNYKPPSGEWGKVYTADDMRYTMLFGVDCIGSDVASTEFTDAQFDQIVQEAVGEFEALLSMDIRKRMYRTFEADPDVEATLTQSRLWREGVDYTDIEDPYDFDPQDWKNFSFVQLRHFPILSVERAIWYSPVKGQVMDMKANKWLRLTSRANGQVQMYPTGGADYGPFSVYGPLWQYSTGSRYPGALEFDYTTGYKTSEFVPDGLRSVIGKYATIKALAIVGDGLMAGFSSQSVSLDGLSESFSSTQSATSAFFGARIKQYSDEIKDWLTRNRYKYSPPAMSFVGA